MGRSNMIHRLPPTRMRSTTAAKHSAISLFCDDGFKSMCRKYLQVDDDLSDRGNADHDQICIGRSVRVATRPNGIRGQRQL